MLNRVLLYLGFVLLGLYVLCVIYPYHFGGYADLPKFGETLSSSTKSFGVTRKALGITRFLPVAIFSYLFSIKFIGITVMVSSIVCIILGSTDKPNAIRIGYTAIAFLITLFAAFNMNNYEIINFVLE